MRSLVVSWPQDRRTSGPSFAYSRTIRGRPVRGQPSRENRFANTARRAYNGRVGSEPYEHTSKIMLTDNARTRIRLTSLSSCAG